jgi:hypothetical protein
MIFREIHGVYLFQLDAKESDVIFNGLHFFLIYVEEIGLYVPNHNSTEYVCVPACFMSEITIPILIKFRMWINIKRLW